jgi:prepilin-type N-terminal cleavage/methylation domain-containing protein
MKYKTAVLEKFFGENRLFERISGGFTLIELMIVVCILGILVAVAIPRFINMTRRTNEAATKGNLAALRSSLSVYYAQNEGTYPTGTGPMAIYTSNITYLQTALVPKYLGKWPVCYVPPYHNKTDTVDEYSTFAKLDPTCDGEWAYIGNPSDSQFGYIFVECWHTDSKGNYISGW